MGRFIAKISRNGGVFARRFCGRNKKKGVNLIPKGQNYALVVAAFFSNFYTISTPRFKIVGTTGFEPATTRPPGAYSTGLNYVPIVLFSSGLCKIKILLLRYICINFKA